MNRISDGGRVGGWPPAAEPGEGGGTTWPPGTTRSTLQPGKMVQVAGERLGPQGQDVFAALHEEWAAVHERLAPWVQRG